MIRYFNQGRDSTTTFLAMIQRSICTLVTHRRFLGTIALAIAVLKLYTKLSAGRSNSYTCLVGKTVLVTGANTGIGYVTALEMAKRGARVILACRNKEKAEEAASKIIQATDNPNIVVGIVDMTSLDSVRQFANQINETETRLDVLVNNVGAGGLGEQTTVDGLEILMQVNYFSSFLLTNLLIDLLKKSAPSRIVNVASMMARFAKLNPSNLNEFTGDVAVYSNTKLCLILFTKELARSLEGANVTAYSLHPGAVITDIYRDVVSISRVFLKIIQAVCFKTPEEGAQTQIFLSTAKGIEHLSGKHFSDCQLIDDYDTTKKPGLARLVWERSEHFVKLTKEEKRL